MKIIVVRFIGLIAACFITSVSYAQQSQEDSLFVDKCMKLAMLGTSEGQTAAANELKAYAARKNDAKGYMDAAQIAFFLGNPILSDSLMKIAAEKFPKSEAAKTVAYGTFMTTTGNAQAIEAAYHKWKAAFPEAAADPFYDAGTAKVALAYAKEKNYKSSNAWTAQLIDESEKADLELERAQVALENGDTAIAIPLMDTAATIARNIAASGKQSRIALMPFLGKYAMLLYQAKKYPAALQVMEEVYQHSPEKSIELEKNYALIMAANKRGSEILPLLSKLVKEGHGNSALLAILKDAWLQDKGSLEGYDAFVAGLRADMAKRVREGLKQQPVNEPAPPFTLKDLDNRTVALQDLKGKIVILDFWATWCGPCKKSFPAMKMAVEKYKSDPKVKFLFIDCMERVADPSEMVRKFINTNNYPFTVLFDNSKTRVAERYKVTGIPVKFIIDGNGKIRYRILGFEGGDDAAVEELSALIEMAKKAS
ncbi:redoxin domain-containing protein [Filimonas effusa]|nr:redoxin domain-containing protein [Filimonas effusa]